MNKTRASLAEDGYALGRAEILVQRMKEMNAEYRAGHLETARRLDEEAAKTREPAWKLKLQNDAALFRMAAHGCEERNHEAEALIEANRERLLGKVKHPTNKGPVTSLERVRADIRADNVFSLEEHGKRAGCTPQNIRKNKSLMAEWRAARAARAAQYLRATFDNVQGRPIDAIDDEN